MARPHLGRYVLGVDAGNSKTVALVARLDGSIVGAGRGGCGDIYGARSASAALAAVEGAVMDALRAAAATPGDLAAGAFSMAGADWPEDVAFLHAAMERRTLGRTIVIVNDALGALRAGSPDGTGVAVVCGTGVAIGARAPQGCAWHTSHWQEPHGSHDLGKKALRAVYRAELGIDPPTALMARVLDLFGLSSVEEVLHALTARTGRVEPDAGRLTRLLLDEAQRGDATAQRIVQEHGAALGDYTLAAARRLGIEGTAFPLVLAGGVLRHPSRLLADALVTRVRATSPAVYPVASRFEPAVGAVFLALEAAGVPVDAPLLARLIPTLPPDALFAT